MKKIVIMMIVAIATIMTACCHKTTITETADSTAVVTATDSLDTIGEVPADTINM